ncbi:MAG TPA: polysaccharide biosynthesis C-terminal domain-containing protein [Bacteroidia bacterium]|nr:polysaccharide biosynthesis C-terminal domain-containing protein [Bacteroidia bacterium]
MLTKIIQTIFSKGIISILNFFVVLITARYLGASGRGEISILFLNVTVILLFNDVIGGNALVYIIPKKNPFSLLLPAVLVGVITGVLLPFLFHLYFHFQTKELIYFILLALLSNISSISNVFLNGLQKIKQNNLASISQSIAIIGSLIIQFFFLNEISVFSFYRSLAFGYLVNLLISTFYLKGSFKRVSFSWAESFSLMARYGLMVQAANIFQLLNYRFCYYVLDSANDLQSRKNVGVFSTASSISEAVWVIMNGITLVQYVTLSNRDNKELAINLTVKLAKISFALSVFALLVLTCLPTEMFTFLFGNDFAEIKTYCLLLAPGIAAYGFAGVYLHYFAATGNMKFNATSALVGLAITLPCSFILIPLFGAKGAAYTNSASYIASSLFILFMFKKQSQTSFYNLFFKWKKLLPLTNKQ